MGSVGIIQILFLTIKFSTFIQVILTRIRSYSKKLDPTTALKIIEDPEKRGRPAERLVSEELIHL